MIVHTKFNSKSSSFLPSLHMWTKRFLKSLMISQSSVIDSTTVWHIIWIIYVKYNLSLLFWSGMCYNFDWTSHHCPKIHRDSNSIESWCIHSSFGTCLYKKKCSYMKHYTKPLIDRERNTCVTEALTYHGTLFLESIQK